MCLYYFMDPDGEIAIICRDSECGPYKLVRFFDGKAVEFTAYTPDDALHLLRSDGRDWREMPTYTSAEATDEILAGG